VSRFADLHIHTYYSDSTASPEEVIIEAKRKGLDCIAITDHDTLEAMASALAVAEEHGLELICGIELSTQMNSRDVHMLGYGMDTQDSSLLKHLQCFRASRIERMSMMIDKLKQMGINDITLEDVCAQTCSDAVGRPHLARLLIERKWVGSVSEAFLKYLGEGCPAFVPKWELDPGDAIRLIHDAGGVAVMAHPMLTNRDEIIAPLVKAGLDGLEVYYPRNTATITAYYEGLAEKHGLLRTGGSDAHGENKKNTFIGRIRIPYELVERLKERIKQRRLKGNF
jgi:predicted metal-dependent phosphoesterase TrpH